MPAAVESAFYVREPAWHKLGRVLPDAPDIETGLVAAGLDYEVEATPVYVNGRHVRGYQANVRNSDARVLGITSNAYKIVQPREAFEFLDALIDEDEIVLEAAGSLYGGRRIWVLAKMPSRGMTIADDAIEAYLFATTSYDGSSCTVAGATNVRIVCANTLDFALREAKRRVSVRHTSELGGHLHQAKLALGMATEYQAAFTNRAQAYLGKKMTPMDITGFSRHVIGEISHEMSFAQADNVRMRWARFEVALERPDLANFRDTAWGVFNATADLASHAGPVARTETDRFREHRWDSLMTGNNLMLKAQGYLDQAVAA